MIEFADPQCPFCANYSKAVLPEIIEARDALETKLAALAAEVRGALAASHADELRPGPTVQSRMGSLASARARNNPDR